MAVQAQYLPALNAYKQKTPRTLCKGQVNF